MKKIRRLARKHKETILDNFGIAVALFFLLMLVAQLFSFELMPSIFAVVLSIDEEIGLVTAAVLIASELLALPFLLSMALSPLMKWLSMMLAGGVTVFWIVVAAMTIALGTIQQNVGLYGEKISLPGGTWLAVMMLGFLAIIIWHAKRSISIKTRS